MWSWKRLASVAALLGGGALCVLVPGLGLVYAGPLLASAGAGLALGTNLKPVKQAAKSKE